MAWGPEQEETIDEAAGQGAAGDGARSTKIEANPGEKVHIDCERIDAAGASDPWRVAVEVSTDPDAPRYSDPPIRNRRYTSAQLTPNFVVSGYYAYFVWIENDDDSPTDEVEVTVRYKKDGVNL